MIRCDRLICCAVGAMLALSATGCGSVSRLVSGKSVSGTGSSAKTPTAVGSFVASVDVRQGNITFRSDKATTTGKARTAAQQFGPGDRITLTGTASYSGSILTGTVTLASGSGYALNDVRAVVTNISDSSVTVVNPDGTTNLIGTNRPFWDHNSLDPGASSTKTWKFSNPGGVNFTFRVTVFANAWTYSAGDSGPNNAVSFPDAQHGWLVGAGGKLLYTKDGGNTWQAQNPGVSTGVELDGVYFANDFDGWVVGSGGTIRRTGDGGRTWFTQSVGTAGITVNLKAVRFINPSTGWIVGANGTILKTTDAGATWLPQSSPRDGILYGVDFADANNGWIVGESGTILHTTNGGLTWSVQSTGGVTDLLLGVAARDSAHAWVCGANGQIMRTTNGISWLPCTSGSTSTLVSIFFINNNTGWAVGGAGVILKTTDGGVSWNQKSNGGATFGPLFIRFIDPNNGWIVGQSGSIMHSTDAGESWTILEQGPFTGQFAVDAPDRNHGWIVGEFGIIRSTNDGGQSWSVQPSGTGYNLYAVRFKNATTGWAVGQNGTIVHTSDGQNWAPQASGTGETLLGVDFVDTNHGCVVGTNGTVLYTDNGGANWYQELTPVGLALNSVSMVDVDLIYAAGAAGRILVSFNASDKGGASWNSETNVYGDDVQAIRMLDANNGWAVGKNGRILHTVDGGGNWDSQRQEPNTNGKGTTLWGADFAAIPMPTPSGLPQQYKYVGWAVGDGGRVLRTTDGGASWTRVDTGTLNTLRGFRFSDPDNGWAVGSFGTVQHLN
jgi:photosystem II stability/assembly factor-like uncharacterized protein